MKKILCLVVFCLLFLFTSCNKVTELNNEDYGKIDYYVSGLYIELGPSDEMKIDDNNPKVYFDFSCEDSFGFLTTTTGKGATVVDYTAVGKDVKIKDDCIVYHGSATFTVKNMNITSITLYPIYVDKNGKYQINDEISEEINIENQTSYSFINYFEYNLQKYKLEIRLLIK